MIQRPGFPVHQIARLGGVTVVTGEPFATPVGQVMAPRRCRRRRWHCHIQYDNYPDGSAVQLKITGDLQRIKGVNCEGSV